MSLRSAVIIVVDRLGAGFLGPYGNTWLDTPAFNRLASRSLLCETVLTDSPQLADVYRSYWTGRHPLAPPAQTSPVAELAEQNIAAVLVTDEPEVAEHPLARGFDQIVRLQSPETEHCADDPAESGISRLFAAAAEALAGLSQPYLLWVHCRGMAGPWDAPLRYREQFRDEEDPLPGDFTTPPQQHVTGGIDPDELLKFTHAYAGQVSLLDEQIGALLETLEPADSQQLLAVTSPRGYPLGEHGRIGACDEALYGELLHVPLVLQFPGQQGALARTPTVLQPADLSAALAAHFDLLRGAESVLWKIARNEDCAPRDLAVSISKQEQAIRTPAWFLRRSQLAGLPHCELFAKPDDRWEVNEISSRCASEMELLVAKLDEFQHAAQSGTLAEIAPLPEVLRDMWR